MEAKLISEKVFTVRTKYGEAQNMSVVSTWMNFTKLHIDRTGEQLVIADFRDGIAGVFAKMFAVGTDDEGDSVVIICATPSLAEKLAPFTNHTVDLKHSAYDQLVSAAGKSKWIPSEYMVNDWLSDCVQFLIEGRLIPETSLRDAFEDWAIRQPYFGYADGDKTLIERDGDGYSDSCVRAAWKGYKLGYYGLNQPSPEQKPVVEKNRDALDLLKVGKDDCDEAHRS
jgi:hypothetical protein